MRFLLSLILLGYLVTWITFAAMERFDVLQVEAQRQQQERLP
ncbi:hypothetical protein [Halomonas lysinitropha]|uniref:Uncharacterized protein n=1 Tax=Halomonas lysinitropha TaxID=2607506 RepID=A0A5K1I8U3_9GAMM|nr:hypothetical protein [Halomonas lysinitropha]VVZ96468.1 hypothetical protein HALO32_02568 [Halomonas lysinitropha]